MEPILAAADSNSVPQIFTPDVKDGDGVIDYLGLDAWVDRAEMEIILNKKIWRNI